MKHLEEAYTPREMARRVVGTGVAKAKLSALDSLTLAVLAGAFIGLGGAFATVAMSGSGLGFGPTRVIGGVAFSLGLILVVVAGAELFTGNNLVAMAWASRAISTTALIRNWILVYAGNLVGSVGTAALVWWTGTWAMNSGSVGVDALLLAAAKCELGFGEAFARGVLCNALVCLAVWLCQSARTTAGKVLSIVWPISAFVALGFEHSVANMYFIPLGLLLRTDAQLLAATPDATAVLEAVTMSGFASNLVPVTLGNIVGGTLMVAGVYWFVYLRPRKTSPTDG